MADDDDNSEGSSWYEEETDDGASSGGSFEEESYNSSDLVAKPSSSSSSPDTKLSMETPASSAEYSASLAGGTTEDGDESESDHSESLVVDMDDDDDESSSEASFEVDEETATSEGDDDSEASMPQSASKWRESYKELSTSRHSNIENDKNDSNSNLNDSKHGLMGGPADFGGSSHHKSDEVLLMSARSINHSHPVDSDDGSSVSDPAESVRSLLKSSISKMDTSDVAELRDMLVAPDDEDEDLERSFQKIISPGYVESKKQVFESLKDKPPPEKPPLNGSYEDTDDDDDEMDYGMLKEDEKEADNTPVDEETQLLILQRKAEKARGDPSNYHSSDDDDSAVLLDDLAQKESNSSLKTDENNDSLSVEESTAASDHSPTAISKQASAKWERSVEGEDEALADSRASIHRQKDLILNTDRKEPIDESENSFGGEEEPETKDLRQDLEAQVKERIQTDDEDVKKELERSIHRVTSQDNSDGSSSSSSSEEEAMEEGTASKSRNDGLPPTAVEVRNMSPSQKAMTFIASKGCIYFMMASVVGLVVAIIVLAVFLAQA